MHELGEVKRAQELRVDEVSVQKFKESHDTIQRLTSQLQEMQEETNSKNDSCKFQEVESNYSGRLSYVSCEVCDIVQSDHAPQAGVAQGIFDGELVRRRVGHQVELEEEQDKEVERRVRRDAQRTTHRCACMDDME